MAAKERPRCRRVIVEQGLRPFLENGQWDGYRCLYPDGTHAHLSDGLRRQMNLMVAEGYWNQPQPSDSEVEARNQKLALASSPNSSCWHCEKPLPDSPWAIYAKFEPLPYLFLFCCASCRDTDFAELKAARIEGHPIDPDALSSFLGDLDNCVGILEGILAPGGMLARLSSTIPERIRMLFRSRKDVN